MRIFADLATALSNVLAGRSAHPNAFGHFANAGNVICHYEQGKEEESGHQGASVRSEKEAFGGFG